MPRAAASSGLIELSSSGRNSTRIRPSATTLNAITSGIVEAVIANGEPNTIVNVAPVVLCWTVSM